MDNDVTEQSEENPEVTSLREENRRLYELVERLIASQESEQAHRKAIESELQQMKEALAEQLAAAQDQDGVVRDTQDSGQDVHNLLEGLGDSLESRLSAKFDDLETRIAALAEAQGERGAVKAGDPDDIANATWKLIAPLGEELERLSGRVSDLGEQLSKSNEAAPDAADTASANAAKPALEALLEDLGQANDRLVATAQDTVVREREDLRDVLETRLSEVGKSMDELLARQDDTQSQTLTLLRGLIDSHIGRLTTEWSSQIDGLKRSVDDLRLEQVSLLNAGSELSDSDPIATGPNGAGQDDAGESENVVAGDFPSFQQAEEPAEEKSAESGKAVAMSSDLRREMQAMEVLPEPEVSDDRRDLEPDASDDTQDEDALLTEPAEWRAETADDDDAFDITPNGVTSEEADAEDEKDGGQSSDGHVAKTASGDAREINLRAYKDLRLTAGPAEADAESGNEIPKEPGKSYENAPAEASLTRFVRMIRARKRSTPS